MKLEMRRQIASWALLAVFLPVLFLASLHRHPASDFSADPCTEGVQHQCHGHLSPLTYSIHQCVLCQFLTLTFVAIATTFVFYFSKSNVLYSCRRQASILTVCGTISLRAPPSV